MFLEGKRNPEHAKLQIDSKLYFRLNQVTLTWGAAMLSTFILLKKFCFSTNPNMSFEWLQHSSIFPNIGTLNLNNAHSLYINARSVNHINVDNCVISELMYTEEGG